MAAPLIALGSALQGYALNTGMELLGGISRAAAMGANKVLPNNPLGMDAYAFLYQNGLMGGVPYQKHLSEMGFTVSSNDYRDMRIFKADSNDVLFINPYLATSNTYSLDRYLAFAKQRPGTDDIFTMLNRGLMSSQCAQYLLKLNFGGEWDFARKYLTLKDQIPGAGELLGFASAHLFDSTYVSYFGLNTEIPVEYIKWMQMQGYGGDTGIPMPPNASTSAGDDNRVTASWFDLYWWNQWKLPDMQQVYEAYNRLYADSPYGPSPYANNNTAVTLTELQQLQRVNNIPPKWRERLQSLSYRPISIRYIKLLVASNVLKEDADNHDVYHAFRSNGYNDVDARRLTQYIVAKARPDIKDLTLQQVKRLYKQGSLSDDAAIQAMKQLDFSTQEATYQVEVMKLTITADTVDYKLKYVRSAYLAGDVSVDDVRSYFLGMQLQQDAQDRYLARWNMQLEVTFKHVSTDKAIKLFQQSYITEDQLRNKLNNLRYSIAEQELLIQEAVDSVAIAEFNKAAKIANQTAKAINKAQVQAVKLATSEAKQLAKAQALVLKDHNAALMRDQRAFTQANIKAFWKARLLSKLAIENILTVKGWLPDTIATWIDTYTPFNSDGTPNVPTKATKVTTVPTVSTTATGPSGLPPSMPAIGSVSVPVQEPVPTLAELQAEPDAGPLLTPKQTSG